jgi:alpha-glucuronidase
VPWDHRLKSGRTLWDELVRHYRRGAEEARAFEQRWAALAGRVDDERHRAVAARLRRQAEEARQWGDRILAYFEAQRRGPAAASPPAAR